MEAITEPTELERAVALAPRWNKASECLPADGQSCILIPRGELSVHGPIDWNESGKCWLDLLATPEAGEFIGVSQVAYWCDAKEILPDDLREIPWDENRDP